MPKQPNILLLSTANQGRIADYKSHFAANRIKVDQVISASDAFNTMRKRGLPHLILLDMTLPTAANFLRRLNDMPLVPVIAIAPDESHDGIQVALDYADDYIRPTQTSPEELLLRIRRVLARIKNQGYVGKLPMQLFDWMRFDPVSREVFLHDDCVSLTPTENALLCLLIKHRGEMVDAYTITERVWHAANDAAKLNALRVHMHRLRTKLSHHSGVPEAIHTDRGIGYTLIH